MVHMKSYIIQNLLLACYGVLGGEFNLKTFLCKIQKSANLQILNLGCLESLAFDGLKMVSWYKQLCWDIVTLYPWFYVAKVKILKNNADAIFIFLEKARCCGASDIAPPDQIRGGGRKGEEWTKVYFKIRIRKDKSPNLFQLKSNTSK